MFGILKAVNQPHLLSIGYFKVFYSMHSFMPAYTFQSPTKLRVFVPIYHLQGEQQLGMAFGS
jgi:hypothetical protein